MSRIIAAIVAATFTVLLSVFALSPSASAYGSPGCWTYTEWQYSERGTMSQIEHYAEVVGLGHVVVYQNGGQNIVKQYPQCNRPQSEGFVQVAYARNVYGQYMAQYVSWWRLGL
jgi:hypothetical protein